MRTHSTFTHTHTFIDTRTDTPNTPLSLAPRWSLPPFYPPPPPYLPEQDCRTESKFVCLSHACLVSGLKFAHHSRTACVCARFTCASIGNTNIYETATYIRICTTKYQRIYVFALRTRMYASVRGMCVCLYVCVSATACKRYVCVSVIACILLICVCVCNCS